MWLSVTRTDYTALSPSQLNKVKLWLSLPTAQVPRLTKINLPPHQVLLLQLSWLRGLISGTDISLFLSHITLLLLPSSSAYEHPPSAGAG